MKLLLKRIVADASRCGWVADVLSQPWSPCADYIHDLRMQRKICPDLTVKHGVFKGMKYPYAGYVGSVLFPKLIGCYERELAPVIEQVCQQSYTEIVDIGCAEGYYAVGLAMRLPEARVFAFDTDRDAKRLCRAMAKINHVSDRLVIGSFCDERTLGELPLTRKALIVSDCEGYEKQLFTAQNAAALRKHDILIEVHDFVDSTISTHLREVFRSTHSLEVYSSIDDATKVALYDYPELHGMSVGEKFSIVRESRPVNMEWFFLKAHEPLDF